MGTKKMGMYTRFRKKTQLFEIWGVVIGEVRHVPCYWCLKILTFKTATIEHLVPRALNGTNEMHNLRVACKECNEGHVNPLDVCHPKQRRLTL